MLTGESIFELPYWGFVAMKFVKGKFATWEMRSESWFGINSCAFARSHPLFNESFNYALISNSGVLSFCPKSNSQPQLKLNFRSQLINFIC